MKTLILYATKHGAAREAAERIAKQIGGAITHDLKQGGVPNIDEFDCVIVGGSIYAGSVRKEAKAFLAQNADRLQGKKLGLFLCGMASDKEKEYLAANYSPEIIQAAKATCFAGSIFDPAKAGAMDRFIVKMITKKVEYADNLNNDEIARFAEEMKA